MRILRAALVALASGIFVACTFTRSLDYLTNGVDGGAGTTSSSSSSGSSGGTSGGGDSSSGQVAPAQGVVLAADQASPTNLAQDGDSIYWTTDEKKVLKVPKAGGATKELAAIPSAALGIAVDPSANGNVFILLADGTMKTIPKSGGPLTAFANLAKGTSLAVDETSLFVTIEDAEVGDGLLKRYPKAGGAAVTISPAGETSLGEILLVGDRVFWASSNAENALVLNEQLKTAATTAPAKVYKNTALDEGAEYGIDPTTATQLAIDDTAIYWIDESIGRPLRLPRAPGVGDARSLVQSKVTPTSLAIDGKYIYIANASEAVSEIIRIPKDGTPPDKLAPQPNPKEVVADDSAIYVAFGGAGGIKPSGGIQKIPTK